MKTILKAQSLSWNSDQIKNLRLRLGWTPSDLARRLNCQSSLVVGWEQGQALPPENCLQELEILLKHADSAADEISNNVLAEVYLEEGDLDQVELAVVKDKFVDN